MLNVSTDVKAEKVIGADAQAQAERWLSRIGGGQAPAAEILAFERWRADPEHAAAYEEVEKLWRIFDGADVSTRAEELIARTLAEVERRKQSQSSRLWLAMAASVAISVIGWGLFWAGQHYVPTKTYVTEFGQRSTIQLDDGSQLILNSATRIDVKFTDKYRQLKLAEGEVLVTVARDPVRPFTVSAGDGEVMALGTRFQVKKHSDEVVVTLLEGRIAVDREEVSQQLRLAPGEQVRFGGNTDVDRRTVDVEEVSSWTQGRLKFKATPLSAVLADINRYTKTQIYLADPALGDMAVNATVEIGNSAAVVAALEAILPVEAQYQGRQRIVLTQKQ